MTKLKLSSSRSHSRSHSRSGQGQGQGQDMVRSWSGHGQVRSNSKSNSNSKVGPELYTKIGFHPLTNPPLTTPSLNDCLVNSGTGKYQLFNGLKKGSSVKIKYFFFKLKSGGIWIGHKTRPRMIRKNITFMTYVQLMWAINIISSSLWWRSPALGPSSPKTLL